MSRNHTLPLARWVVLVLAAAFVVGCSDEDDLGILEGSVTVDGSSTRGVTVEIAGDGEATLETGALGAFAIELLPGDYTVTLIDGLPPDVACTNGLSRDVTIEIDVVTEVTFACETTAGGS